MHDSSIITRLVEENPRKKGTHGFRSFQILLDGGEMSVAEYILRGGRRNDLAWDLDHGWVQVKPQ